MERSAADRRLTDIATPSGKDRHTENFPVGSLLIRRDLRSHVHAFYRFARMADDIADNPALSAEEKINRLNLMEETLTGNNENGPAVAIEMHHSLRETGVSDQHCRDLLTAFRLDAVKQRYKDWAELMDYCRYSASPVGRYLLDLHGEDRSGWASSDALCNALQVINHLQDCQEDARIMGRIYLPLDHFAEFDITPEDVLAPASKAGMRRLLDTLLDGTAILLQEADKLPSHLKDFRLRAESAIIVNLAHRLVKALRKRDPLAERVKLGKGAIVLAAIGGVGRALMGARHG